MSILTSKPLDPKDAIAFAGAFLAVLIGLCQYRATSRSEFLKPIRENQLNQYVEASGAAASLATLEPKSPEWNKAKNDFLRLYYGPLAMVEDYQHELKPGEKRQITVELAMIAFDNCLESANCTNAKMRNLSLALAHTCRSSLGNSWGFKAKELEGDYQKMIEQYLEPQPETASPNR